MSIDVIGNYLTIIRNGIKANHNYVSVIFSLIKFEITKILYNEGYISFFEVKKHKNIKNFKYILIYLKYKSKKDSAIKIISRVSKPGVRIYYGYQKIPRLFSGYGQYILSTSKGVMTGKSAKINKVGGEVLFYIF